MSHALDYSSNLFLFLRLFYIFVSGISEVLGNKKGVLYQKCILIFIMGLLVPITNEHKDSTVSYSAKYILHYFIKLPFKTYIHNDL